mmetsp:Transcript_14781/g.36848  ORF Transcript_14781/g.36848 Transcript_14781/m.36848 type:complete len:126 (-) Transcript_14781:1485-1862(-)
MTSSEDDDHEDAAGTCFDGSQPPPEAALVAVVEEELVLALEEVGTHEDDPVLLPAGAGELPGSPGPVAAIHRDAREQGASCSLSRGVLLADRLGVDGAENDVLGPDFSDAAPFVVLAEAGPPPSR